MSLITAIRCPLCGHEAEEEVPVNACVVRYPCPGCGGEVRPREGDCCVFCSWGADPCPTAPEGQGRVQSGE